MGLEEFGAELENIRKYNSRMNRDIGGPYDTEEPRAGLKTQWTLFPLGNNSYQRCGQTITTLPAGFYEIPTTHEGEPVYSKLDVKVDNLIAFNDSIAEQVLNEIDLFFKDATRFKEMGFLHRRGYLFYGAAGCHNKGTQVIMFDGTFKKVEDVQVGDLLMGPDSKPRKILELVRGSDEMFEITPTKGDSFIVNRDHILHLTPTNSSECIKVPLNIKLEDFIEKSTLPFKERYKLTRADTIHFSNTKTLPLNPYILGLWLGDGNARNPALTNTDPEIIKIWTDFAREKNLFIRQQDISYTITSGMISKKFGRNEILNMMKQMNVINNKHVPPEYLIASEADRLELIAGLLDTDGHLAFKHYDFVNKNKQIADSMLFLCRSVGLAAYMKVCEKGCWVQGGKHYKKGMYYRIFISGNTDKIPCRIPRKQAQPRQQIKSVLRTGFTYNSLGQGDYYGFILNGDHLYLTSDFTIHHNSGKSCIVQQILAGVIKRNGVAFMCDRPHLLITGLHFFREIEPDRPVLCIFEDIDAIIEKYGEDSLLSLLDGEKQADHVLNLASTNYPEKLDRRLVARPRRFDRIVKINYPDYNIRLEYFKQKLSGFEQSEIEHWAKETEGLAFSALAEMIISVTCLNIPFAEALDILRNLAVNKVSSRDCEGTDRVGF